MPADPNFHGAGATATDDECDNPVRLAGELQGNLGFGDCSVSTLSNDPIGTDTNIAAPTYTSIADAGSGLATVTFTKTSGSTGCEILFYNSSTKAFVHKEDLTATGSTVTAVAAGDYDTYLRSYTTSTTAGSSRSYTRVGLITAKKTVTIA